MSKLTLTNPTSGYLTPTVEAANNAAVVAAVENTLSRDGTTPNQMSANLDMNSHEVTNLAAPTTDNSAVRLIDVATGSVTIVGVSAPSQTGNSGKVLATNGASLLWADAAGSTAPLHYDRSTAEIAAAILPTDYSYPFNRGGTDVRRYGITCNGSTDDTAAWNALGITAWTQNVSFFVSSGLISLISNTITLPGPRISLMMDPSARINYTGTYDRAALVLGSDSTVINDRDFNVSVITPIGNPFTNTACIGIQIRGTWAANRVRINYVSGFTVNTQLWGTNAGGIAYNTFDMGASWDSAYHLDLHSAVASGFINENLFLNGQFQTSSGGGLTTGRPRYGVIFQAEAGAYTGQNKNHFIKPCFQLAQAGITADAVPIVFNNAGINNQFSNVRAEGVNGEVVRVTANSISVKDNLIDVGYALGGTGTLTAFMTETDGGLSSSNRITLGGVSLVSSWDSGDLVQKAFINSAGNISILNAFMQSSAAGVEVSAIGNKIGKDYIISTTSLAIGFYVDTTFYKNLEVRANIFNARGGRISFVAYDSTGAQISTANAIYGAGVTVQSATFGTASYNQSVDGMGLAVIRVDSNVAKIKVLFYGGTNPLLLKSVRITGYSNSLQLWSALGSTSANAGLLVYGGAWAPVAKTATAIPTALGDHYTFRGDTRWNSAAASAAAAGWICNASGWNAVAWVLTTAYKINQLVVNGGNVYVCKTDGTSAGAGGPAGTGTAIVDNTTTWDYIGAGTISSPSATNATWTALANVP